MTDTPDQQSTTTYGIWMTLNEERKLKSAERLFEHIARLTRERDAARFERDAARDECSKWRANFAHCLTTWERHPCTSAMSKHDAACPGWEEAK
jgi:hypothetical protein